MKDAMKLARHTLAVTLILVALSPPVALAQTPAAAASAASAAGPRALTPAEKRESALPPDEAQPAGKANAQISIPFGKTVPPAAAPPRPRRAAASGSGGVADAAARCEAQSDAGARGACRNRQAHDTAR